MQADPGNIVLFYPHITEKGRQALYEQSGTRWIGQGPAVDEFESRFSGMFCGGLPAGAVGSGTDALHLAYLLSDVGPGDEVIAPVFTCTATNIPLLYIGAKPVFADVQKNTLNMDPEHVRSLVSAKTKAIVCVHYGGLPCDMDELRSIADDAGVPLIEDAAHALGASYKGKSVGSMSDFTMFSFQAIKHITTGDGGMLTFRDKTILPKFKRLRWFGIDREGKQNGHWENDIWEVGYKYQMTDLAARLGLAALDEWDSIIGTRTALYARYREKLQGIPGLQLVDDYSADKVHAAWLCTVLAEKRRELQAKLRENGIESNQVHFRNDKYTLFAASRGEFPNMDSVEDNYLVLPLHTKMVLDDVDRVVDVIRSGW